MNPDPRLQALLEDVLAENAPDAFRHSCLERTIGLARRRRRIRHALRSGSMALFLASAVAAWLLVPARENPATVGPGPTEPARSDRPGVAIQSITDEELLAAFPDRPLALIGPPGRQELVFLDEQEDRASRPH